MNKELNKQIELANKEIKRIVDFLKENKESFSYMDLKLYDIFYKYYRSEEMKKEFPLCYEDNFDYFSDFCELNYNFFLENLQENYDIDFEDMYYQLGRTSKFYLHDNNLIDIDSFNNIDYDYTVYNLINDYSEANGYGLYSNFENEAIKIDKDYLESIKDYKEEVENEIDYIINDLYIDFMSHCDSIIKVYTEIKNFKDNQIVYFKNYLENEEEKLKEYLTNE